MIILIVEAIGKGILEVIYPNPRNCPLCGSIQGDGLICSECLKKIKEFKNLSGQCTRCGTFSRHGTYCPNCVKWPEGYLKNIAPVPYQDEYEEMIHRFKYGYQGYLAKAISILIFQELLTNPALIRDLSEALIIPVPMSRGRKKKKGYNHAEIIAEEFSRIVDKIMLKEVLLRPGETRHQVGLNSFSRRKNMKEAISINARQLKRIENKTIILVDDVMTTSATLQECAKILLNNGAAKVFSVTFCAGNPGPSVLS